MSGDGEDGAARLRLWWELHPPPQDPVRERIESAEREATDLRAEVAKLRRMIEHAVPWQVSDEPTDEEMRALRLRWAFGPEKYQADADILIGSVMRHRAEKARLMAEVDTFREAVRVAACNVAHAASPLDLNFSGPVQDDALETLGDAVNALLIVVTAPAAPEGQST